LLLYHIRQVAALNVKLLAGSAFVTPLWKKGRSQGVSDGIMAPFETVMVVPYTLCIVTTVLSLTIWLQFAVECLQALKSTGVDNFGAKFGEEGMTNVSHILTQCGRNMGLSYAKQIMMISFAI